MTADEIGNLLVYWPGTGGRAGARLEEPPTQPSLLTRATPVWIRRVARPTERPGEAQSVPLVSVPALVAAGVVGLSGLAVVTMVLGWFLFSPSQPAEEKLAQPEGADQEERYQGVKVKKGLQ